MKTLTLYRQTITTYPTESEHLAPLHLVRLAALYLGFLGPRATLWIERQRDLRLCWCAVYNAVGVAERARHLQSEAHRIDLLLATVAFRVEACS